MAFLPKIRPGALVGAFLLLSAVGLSGGGFAQESPCAECHDDVHLGATPRAERAIRPR